MSHIPGNTADTELVETGDVKCPAVYKISPGDRNQPGPKRQLLLRNTVRFCLQTLADEKYPINFS